MHSFDDDNELDQITRLASEAYEAPGNANWEKMQLVLDKQMPQQKKRRGIIWWLLPLGIAAAIGLYWITNITIHQDFKNTVPETKNTLSTNKLIIENLILDSNNNISDQKPKPTPLDQNNNTNKIDKKSFEIIETKLETKAAPSLQDLTQTKREDSVIDRTNLVKSFSSLESLNPVLETQKSIHITPLPDSNTTKRKSNKVKNTDPKKGVFIGLVGGIDASTVKYNYGSPAGYNIGVTIGYRFNNHWSLQSGAIYTKKNYKMRGEDFHPPKGSWISYFKLETVDGFCKMWELPIIGTYHFTSNGKTNAFISLGTSSYFMKKENYSYEYYVNNQTYNRTINYNSTDQHLFALMHISAGIENKISNRLTAIIEPYAKIPLAGVGFGSIQLSSYGVNFSVQYRQPKKQSSRFDH